MTDQPEHHWVHVGKPTRWPGTGISRGLHEAREAARLRPRQEELARQTASAKDALRAAMTTVPQDPAAIRSATDRVEKHAQGFIWREGLAPVQKYRGGHGRGVGQTEHSKVRI